MSIGNLQIDVQTASQYQEILLYLYPFILKHLLLLMTLQFLLILFSFGHLSSTSTLLFLLLVTPHFQEKLPILLISFFPTDLIGIIFIPKDFPYF